MSIGACFPRVLSSRSDSGRNARVSIALAGTMFLMGACSGEGGDPRAEPTVDCPRVVELEDTRPLPKRFPLASWGTVIKVQKRAGFVGAEAVTAEKIVELYPRIVRELGDAGFTFLGGENEGFEAEIAFQDARNRSGTLALRERPCAPPVVVRALVDIGGAR